MPWEDSVPALVFVAHPDRRLERTLAMLLRLKDLGQGAVAG
jgi:hypothetical protein